MINGSEKRNRLLAFELQNSIVCENRSKLLLVYCSVLITSVCISSVFFFFSVFFRAKLKK